MFKKPEIYKVIYFSQFMLWFSYLIFIDSYLIIFENKNIFDINFKYIKDYLAHIPIMIVIYIFLMSVISSILQQCIQILKYFKDIILIKYFDKVYESNDLTNYMSAYKIKNIATVQNNSVLYNEYKIHKNLVNEILTEKKIASGLVSLCLINYFISTESVVSFLKAYELLFDNPLDWYLQILNIIPLSVIVFVLIIAFKEDELLDYMYIDKTVQKNLFE